MTVDRGSPSQATEPPKLGVANAARRDRLRAALFERALPPVTVGRYEVVGPLGQGGMGVVLEARDPTLDRTVALKLLHPDQAQLHEARLLREARTLAKLSHPNVVQIYEVAKADDGRLYIAMELVGGSTLHAWQKQRPQWRECVRAYIDAGRGLAAAHALGVVHRDFKPHNCMRDEEGRVRVLDFGLAAAFNQTSTDPIPTANADASGVLTRPGSLLGTPAYMAPEQLDGSPADAHSDQFSFCVSLYEALYGVRPFSGTSATQLRDAITEGQPAEPRQGSRIPDAVRAIVVRGLRAPPGDRWPSMDALLRALIRLLGASRRRATAGATVALLGGALGLGMAIRSGPQPCEDASKHLLGVWDQERRGRLEHAMLGTGLPYATETLRRVAEHLDRYTTAWLDMHTEACEATAVRAEQSAQVLDQRMSCLAQRRTALDQTLAVMVEGGETTLERAMTMIDGLPSIGGCADLVAIAAATPPPDDPRVAEEVDASRTRLARAKALALAGTPATARTLASTVTDEAEALGYGPLLAESLLSLGAIQSDQEHFEDAAATMRRAYLEALRHDHLGVAARAQLGRARALRFLGRADQGLQSAEVGLALAQRGAADPRLEVDAEHAIGQMLHSHGEHEPALEHLDRALDLASRRGIVSGLGLARIHRSLGAVRTDRDEHEHAREHFRRAIDLSEAELGPDHPEVAMGWSELSVAERKVGRNEPAEAAIRRALSIWERGLGSEHPLVGRAWNRLSTVLLHRGDLALAETAIRRALAIRESHYGPRDAQVATSLANLASIQLQRDDAQGALETFSRVESIWEATLPSDHPHRVSLANAKGNTYLVLEQWSKALTAFEEARNRAEELGNPLARPLAMALAGEGSALHHQGHSSEAVARLERALEIYEQVDTQPSDVALTRAELAKALWAVDRTRFGEVARQAHTELAAAGPAVATHLKDFDAWLTTRGR